MKITEDAVGEKVKAILFCENVKKVMSCHEPDSVHAPASSKKTQQEFKPRFLWALTSSSFMFLS